MLKQRVESSLLSDRPIHLPPACFFAACCPLLTATALVAVPVLQRTLSGIAVTSVRRGRGSGQYLRRKHFGETKIASA